jgi:arginine decarboxylase
MEILNSLNKIVKKDITSFHVPGHKKGSIYERLGYKDVVSNLYAMDTTEIPGTDNLHNPEDVIKISQDNASNTFGSDYTFYLVNGSTCGIQSAIMSVCNPKEKLIANRDCHQSIINACILGDIEPVYINPNIDLGYGISIGYTLNDIKDVVENNLDAKGVLLTYPSYFGTTYDLKSIADYIHSKGMILIIDEAHGSHLDLSDKLPNSALKLGADVVIHSIHKTLPSFTQSSMMHIKGDKVNIEKIRSYLRILQSSSPSYMLLSSLELAVEIYKNNGKNLMEELIYNIIDLNKFIKKLDNIKVYEQNDQDITKIYILTKDLGITGYELEDILRNKYKIQVELSNYYGVLLISSIGNTANDFDKLKNALSEIDKLKKDNELSKTIKYPSMLSKKLMSPRDAFYSKKVDININKSIGKICGEYIIPYPPGVSLISPGEEINKEAIDYVLYCKKLGMAVNGVKDNNLEYIQIIDEE